MKIDFNKSNDGLIPAIIQDYKTGMVLMLGYMNEESLIKTQKEKRVTFYSRSKQRLWTKGETSGIFLDVEEIIIDCDNDTLLIKVVPVGPACHTGSDTCFKEDNISQQKFLYELEEIIDLRKKKGDNKSYVKQLFNKGINKIAQKVGEEAVELIIESKEPEDKIDSFKDEAADLLFHYLVLLNAKNVKLADIEGVLKRRHAN